MSKAKPPGSEFQMTDAQKQYLEERMSHFVDRNPSCGISRTDYPTLFFYLAVQKITYLYDDELLEGLKFVDRKLTGKSEELLDAYLIVDQGGEIQLQNHRLPPRFDSRRHRRHPPTRPAEQL
jgi:hypothetical protein